MHGTATVRSTFMFRLSFLLLIVDIGHVYIICCQKLANKNQLCHWCKTDLDYVNVKHINSVQQANQPTNPDIPGT